MTEKYKLIIADDEKLICEMMNRLIDFERLGLELVGTAFDGQMLLSMIEEMNPDIVVTDINMPVLDGLEIIRRVHTSERKCRFVVISGYKQFDYAYNAIKYNVDNFILKPIDQEELNQTLAQITGELRKKEETNDFRKIRGAARSMLFRRSVDEKVLEILPTERMNRQYFTSFREGMLQMLSIMVDYAQPDTKIFNNDETLPRLLPPIVRGTLENSCHDILVRVDPISVKAIMNYDQTNAEECAQKVKELYEKVQDLANRFEGVSITLCLTEAKEGLESFNEFARQLELTEWSRMAYGVNRVLNYSQLKVNYYGPLTKSRIEKLETEAIQALEVYDVNGIEAALDMFFAFPGNMLCSYEAMHFAREVVNCTSRLLREKLDITKENDLLIRTLEQAPLCCISFEMLRLILKENIRTAMKLLVDELNKQNARPVKQAFSYVEKNYAKPITLEMIAAEVALNPVYFSALFKKRQD